MTLFEYQNVSKFRGNHAVIHDFSLAVEQGERIVLFGPSGCGKTTLLRMLAGFTAPDRGAIVINGKIAARDGRTLLVPEERNLGMVFQDLALWPHLTVYGNLEFGLKAKGLPRTERARRIDDMLALLKIESYATAKPHQLSGGEQQRVALARALVMQPLALLMDEPLSSLDEELNLHLRREIVRLQQALKFTLFYVTHSRSEAEEIGTRMVLLQKHGSSFSNDKAYDLNRYNDPKFEGDQTTMFSNSLPLKVGQ
jgi:iron(III) transport system ATP-binding protein